MGHPLFSKNLRKMLTILIIKEDLVCLIFDGNKNFTETNTRAESGWPILPQVTHFTPPPPEYWLRLRNIDLLRNGLNIFGVSFCVFAVANLLLPPRNDIYISFHGVHQFFFRRDWCVSTHDQLLVNSEGAEWNGEWNGKPLAVRQFTWGGRVN